MRKRFIKATTLNFIVVVNLVSSPFPCLDPIVFTKTDNYEETNILNQNNKGNSCVLCKIAKQELDRQLYG